MHTPRVLKSVALAAILGVFSLALATDAGPAPAFPVPRAEKEFRELIPFVAGWGQKNPGDKEMFLSWALPFGPLSLEVRRADYAEASALINFYFGISGSAFGLESKELTELGNRFHCGPECTFNRWTDIRSKLDRIEPLVSQFRGLAGVRVLANWGHKDDYRINDLYCIGGQQMLTRPSPIMGFVPSSDWTSVENRDQYIASLGAKPAAVHEVLAAMRELSLAAIVLDPDGAVRVVRVGIGDNESGLLFTTAARGPYRQGEQLKDGRKVTLVENLKANVFLYETT